MPDQYTPLHLPQRLQTEFQAMRDEEKRQFWRDLGLLDLLEEHTVAVIAAIRESEHGTVTVEEHQRLSQSVRAQAQAIVDEQLRRTSRPSARDGLPARVADLQARSMALLMEMSNGGVSAAPDQRQTIQQWADLNSNWTILKRDADRLRSTLSDLNHDPDGADYGPILGVSEFLHNKVQDLWARYCARRVSARDAAQLAIAENRDRRLAALVPTATADMSPMWRALMTQDQDGEPQLRVELVNQPNPERVLPGEEE